MARVLSPYFALGKGRDGIEGYCRLRSLAAILAICVHLRVLGREAVGFHFITYAEEKEMGMYLRRGS